MQNIDWVFELKNTIPKFLKKLKGEKAPGFFHYSLSGDLYNENIKWGLGNTVFAVKIYYILNQLEKLPSKEKKEIIQFIKSFEREDGSISDPLVSRKARPRNIASALTSLNFQNAFGQKTKRAETRQAISSLKLLSAKPDHPYQNFPKTKRRINLYLNKLNWQKPWDAGSHFSHLVFFLQNSNLKNKKELTTFALKLIARLEHSKDGAWYCGKPPLQEKINGAMKIITGFRLINYLPISYPEKLIDLCLQIKYVGATRGSPAESKQACDILNTLYVLYHAYKKAGGNYQPAEIKRFAQNQLKHIYHDYYFPKVGAFSLLPHKANVYYYNAKITKGKREPDIHGTLMFLWAISLIARILKIPNQFQELTP